MNTDTICETQHIRSSLLTFEIIVNAINETLVRVRLSLLEPYQSAVNIRHWSISHSCNQSHTRNSD